MNCCPICFSSNYLMQIINSESTIGNCDFCKSSNVKLKSAKDLIVFFRNLLDQYEIDSKSGRSIIDQIQLDFPDQIFPIAGTASLELLNEIISTESTIYSDLLTNNVSIKKRTKHISEAGKLWANFKNEIKSTNRFHIKNILDLSNLEKLFTKEDSLTRYFDVKTTFYRGRICNISGRKITEMGPPPPEKARSGRANPRGISYLYLADEPKTAIYELRSTLYDYIAIGKFESIEKLKVLNLRDVSYDPMSWTETEDVEDFLIYSPFIKNFQEDLSIPIRRNDMEIDYLPTQYLCEFIKSIGFDGVEYQSSLYKKGYNLAIFQYEKLECVNVELHEVTEIDLDHQLIT